MNSVSAKPKAATGIRHMSIEPADGGVLSNLRMREAPGKMSYMEPPPPTVHPTLEHLVSHVTKHFGHMFPKGTSGAKAAKVADTDGDKK